MAMSVAMLWRSHNELDWPFANSVADPESRRPRACVHICCFSHMGFAQQTDISCVAPPNMAHRVHLQFLSSRQGKKEVSDYVQQLRTRLAAMQLGLPPEAVQVTI